MPILKFRLYVAGDSPQSQRAILNLRRICQEELDALHEILVIDVMEEPELAEADGILATPTLIKAQPEPETRVIGDLSSTRDVLLALNLL
jgi:circadian clock protein KaiB